MFSQASNPRKILKLSVVTDPISSIFLEGGGGGKVLRKMIIKLDVRLIRRIDVASSAVSPS